MTPTRSTSRARCLVHLVLLPLLAGVLVVLVGPAPAEAAGIYLHRGSRGPAVTSLETRLVKVAGLPRTAVDRRYRAVTTRAVRRFQSAHRLRVTGTVNQRVWDAVASAYRLATAPKPPVWTRPAWAPPQVTAHRGGSREAPENTLLSIRHGALVGAPTVEFDVRSTADHQLVLMHDRTLDRTTTCTGPVTSVTLVQLQSCRTDVGAQPVPTLDQVLDYLVTVPSVALSPEVKDYGTDLTDEEVTALVAAVQVRGLAARTYLQSFAPAVFPKIRALDPDVKLVYLSQTVVLVSAVRAWGADIASVNMNALARSNVDTYHRLGVPIWTWTADTTPELQRVWSLGVDSVGTDIPTQALALYR